MAAKLLFIYRAYAANLKLLIFNIIFTCYRTVRPLFCSILFFTNGFRFLKKGLIHILIRNISVGAHTQPG